MAEFQRIVPEIPPPGKRLRVIIDTDAACEVDDHYAIALALLSPERFAIEGFVATHFGDAGGPDGTRRSAADIRLVLAKAGMEDRYAVMEGGDPIAYSARGSDSEGARFIIDRALAGPADEPLWVIGLGAATNIASAYLLDPAIAPRVRVFYHGRTQHWPARCQNFNVENDVRAFRVLLNSPLAMVLFDTGTHLTLPMATSQRRLAPLGPLGCHLHEIRHRKAWWEADDKGLFDLGDISALIDPAMATWERVKVPALEWDKSYRFDQGLGEMLRVTDVDRDRTFRLLFERLAAYAAS